MSYEQKLMQMKKLLKKKEPEAETKADPVKRPVPPSPSYEENWLAAGLEKEENELGVVYKRVVRYPGSYEHGHFTLSELKQAMEQWERFDGIHPLCPDLARPILFFDTETTGLKGAGTLIFLMGFIEQEGDAFKLTQYVLPGPDHEAAFLHATPMHGEPASLVMYNGKSFDMPQVETRWTMNRESLPKIADHTQIDLLHGSRRIWKGEMGSFKLTQIEQEQLGFYRYGDMPGHMAPIVYQDAVKSGNPELLMKVLLHNEWDILSLVTLYIRTTDLLLREAEGESAAALSNIGKWYYDLKAFDRSRELLAGVIAEHGLAHPLAHFHYGYALKKDKAHSAALEAFSTAAVGLKGRERIVALEEVAKICEHHTGDLKRALAVTDRALLLLNKEQELPRKFRERMKDAFRKREMRLERKLFPGQAQQATKYVPGP